MEKVKREYWNENFRNAGLHKSPRGIKQKARKTVVNSRKTGTFTRKLCSHYEAVEGM